MKVIGKLHWVIDEASDGLPADIVEYRIISGDGRVVRRFVKFADALDYCHVEEKYTGDLTIIEVITRTLRVHTKQ